MKVLVAQSCLTLCDHGQQPARLLCPWNPPGKNTEVGCHPPPGDLPNPGIKPGSPALQAETLPTAPPRKSCNLTQSWDESIVKDGGWGKGQC